jgi:hypothetical protein
MVNEVYDCRHWLEGSNFLRIRSVGYGFQNGKRDVGDGQCVKADVLGLKDGTRYNISAVGLGRADELFDRANGRAGTRIIPKYYDAFLIQGAVDRDGDELRRAVEDGSRWE